MVSSLEIRSNCAAGGLLVGGHYTLGDWIGRVRSKRREVRRKNANLRVAAMLATTLRRAEADLRVRQLERANKWAALNQQIAALPSSMSPTSPPPSPPLSPASFEDASSSAEQQQLHQQQIQQQNKERIEKQQQQHQQQQKMDEELWRNELSGLDQFMQSLNQVKTCVVR